MQERKKKIIVITHQLFARNLTFSLACAGIDPRPAAQRLLVEQARKETEGSGTEEMGWAVLVAYRLPMDYYHIRWMHPDFHSLSFLVHMRCLTVTNISVRGVGTFVSSCVIYFKGCTLWHRIYGANMSYLFHANAMPFFLFEPP
jgi:hypothetical protein